MQFLVALKKIKTKAGFHTLEILIVTIIVGIATAIGAPSLISSARESESKKAFTDIRGALIEARINANRQSIVCIVTFTKNTTNNEYDIAGSPSGCVLEPFSIDADVVTISSTGGAIPNSPATRNIAFDFDGSLDETNTTDTDLQTLWITRNDFSGNPLPGLGRCIVVGNSLGMITTGIDDGNGVCDNVKNQIYDNYN